MISVKNLFLTMFLVKWLAICNKLQTTLTITPAGKFCLCLGAEIDEYEAILKQ